MTMEIGVNFLAPVQEGRLVVKGRCIKIGRTLALGDFTIYNGNGKPLSPRDSDDDDRAGPESRRPR